DFAFGTMKGSGSTTTHGVPASVEVDDFATVRARVGYVAGPTLLYVTGGFAYVREKAFEATPTAVTTTKFYDLGWTVGAGVEYMIAPRWSAKLEYLYASFDHPLSDAFGFDLSNKQTINTVRAGVNYKFDLAEFLGRL